MRATRRHVDEQEAERPTGVVGAVDRPAETYLLGDRATGNDTAISLLGVVLAAVGILALTRTDLDDTWYQPVVEVLGARHTPLLGLAEAGAGTLLVLAGLARLRGIATVVGLTTVVIGTLAAVENAQVHRELAIEPWWAWALVAWGLIVSVVALAPSRQDRVERVVETH